jgi:hypothetical protein
MHPVEGSLYIRKFRLQTAKNIGFRSYSEGYTTHYSGKAEVGYTSIE